MLKSNFPSILFILLFVQYSSVFAIPLKNAQDNNTFIGTSYTTENGIPQNTPTSIVQTKDGYIWISTFGGLARFDGVNFTKYNSSTEPAIVNNRLTALYEDPQGNLWIGSETGDLIKHKDGIFTTIIKDPNRLNENTISTIYLDNNDTLWLATANGLKTFNLKTQQYTFFDNNKIFKNLEEVPNGETKFKSIAVDNQNNIWIASNGGLFVYRDGTLTNINKTDGLPDNSVNAIKSDPNGGLWVLTNTAFGKFENGIFTTYKDLKNQAFITPALVGDEQHIYFSVNKNLYEVSGKEIIEHNISDYITPGVTSMLLDADKNLWLGTDVDLVQLKQRFIEVLKSELPTQAIIQDFNNTVWINQTNKVRSWRNGLLEDLSIGETKPRTYTTALAIDKQGDLWVGTSTSILKYSNGNFTSFDDNKLINRGVNSLYFDSRGRFWIGTRTEGLIKYENGVFKYYSTEDGLAGNSITYITEDSHGVIWIGSYNGLSRIENEKIESFNFGSENQEYLVRDIYEDKDGTYWIGTYGNGIIRFKNGHFTSITTQNGLAEDIASRILTDEKDNFWILGNQGIYTVSRQSLNDFADGISNIVICTVYGTKDGMEVSEGNGGQQPSGWKTHDGKLWFSMIRGAVVIDPKAINYSPPPIFIDSVTLDQKKIDLIEGIDIFPSQQNIQINYTAINFTKPDQVHFLYMLDGLDKDWYYAGTRRTAFYSYLPPGEYKFKVKAGIGNVWSKNIAVLNITVYAPFWKKPWFYFFIFLSLLSLIIYIYHLRLQRAMRIRLRQQEFSRQLINAHESERRRIAVELHDGLGQALLVIKNWALLGLNEAPKNSKLLKQLEEISETASYALDETRTIAHNLRPQHLQRFGLTETIKNMVENVSESSGIKFDTNIEEVDNLFSDEAEINIFRIIQETLNNIVKHSEATHALVSIKRFPHKITIQIEDNGKGFKTIPLKANLKENIDFGINNIIQRVELLGGKFVINSRIGHGTRIFISTEII